MSKIFLALAASFWIWLSPLVFQTPLSSAQGCNETVGQIDRNNYRSTLAETNMVYSIYTPPCYDPNGGPYPVIYLMHGSNEDDGQWPRLGIQDILDAGIHDGTLPSMIVVMPFGNWMANENQFDRGSWENVFLNELMPLAEANYRIDTRREYRAIGGISRGGFWAFEIAFRHPELFSILGGHSAFFAVGNAPKEYNPLDLTETATGIDGLRIALDRGKDDFAAPGLDLMDKLLTKRGIEHAYTVYPEGQHYLTYWRQHVAEYLQFYASSWLTSQPMATPFAFATNTPSASVSTAVSTATSLPPTVTATTNTEAGYDLFLPAAAFPSLQSVVSLEQLQAIASSGADSKLVLNQATASALAVHGIVLNAAITVLPDEALLNVLWRDRSLYTLLPFNALTTRYRMLHVQFGDTQPLYDLPGEILLDAPDLSAYPFKFASETPNFYPSHLTRLLLSGVTALTRLTRKSLDENGVVWAGEAIQSYVAQPDYFHTSNEVSFAPDCPQFTTQPLGEFCSKKPHFDLLTNLGLDIVELTGNHNNDYGTENYLETLNWYREKNIRTLGGGENLEQARQPLILEHNGSRIAMLACNWVGPYYAIAGAASPGAAFCDWDWLRVILPQLKAENDLVIVTTQYQEYEDYKPTAQQESDFRGLADLGADVVIGTQAHKPQTFEFYNTAQGSQALLHYGMGNLFFDQPFWGNMRFFMDQLFIYEGKLVTIDLFTGIIDDLARPRPMTADEQFNFLAFMFNTQAGS